MKLQLVNVFCLDYRISFHMVLLHITMSIVNHDYRTRFYFPDLSASDVSAALPSDLSFRRLLWAYLISVQVGNKF